MAADNVIVWNRVRYTLAPFRDGHRLRSRRKGNEFDWLFPACSLEVAKREALERFRGEAPPPARTAVTFEDAVTVYTALPKKAGEASAKINVSRLRAIVRLVHSKELERVLLSELSPKLWASFMAARQGGKLDLAKRRAGNAAINSAVRQAASIFIDRLRPGYREAGIEIPSEAAVVQWLPEMKLPKPEANAQELEIEWRKLKETDPALYFAVGLARWAGLRQQEICACRRNWIVERNGAVYVELRDRPDENFTSKTGEMYRAPVVDPDFAAALLTMPPGYIVPATQGMRRDYWYRYYPQEWLRPFTGSSKKPLHRLRGLYADDVKQITEVAMAANLAGIKAASDALGHTTTKTTKDSYLSDHAIR